MDYIDFIRRRMKELDISQKEIADNLNINRSLLSRYLTRDVVMSADLLIKIMNLLKLDFNNFKEDEELNVVKEPESIYMSPFQMLENRVFNLETEFRRIKDKMK